VFRPCSERLVGEAHLLLHMNTRGWVGESKSTPAETGAAAAAAVAAVVQLELLPACVFWYPNVSY